MYVSETYHMIKQLSPFENESPLLFWHNLERVDLFADIFVVVVTDVSSIYAILFFFFFWAGIRDPISCSLLGGGIPSQNSGNNITRVCPSLC